MSGKNLLRLLLIMLFYHLININLTIAQGPMDPFPDVPCTLKVSPLSFNVSHTSSTNSVYVTTGSGCFWSVNEAVSWITLNTSTGIGSTSFKVTCTANTSTSSRTGNVKVVIGGVTHTIPVTQSGKPTPPAAPPKPGIYKYYKESTRISTISSGSSNIKYYWQGRSCGTSTASSAVTYNITSSGRYYLRAKNTSTGLWSTSCAYIDAQVYSNPPVPSTPINTYSHNLTKVNKPGASSDCIVYWQTSPSGLSMADAASYKTTTTPYIYILRQKHKTSGLWSDVKTVAAPIYSNPATLSNPTISYGNNSSSVSKPAASSGCIVYWQANSLAKSASDAVSLKTFSSGTTVYFRQRHTISGLWSAVRHTRQLSVITYSTANNKMQSSYFFDITILFRFTYDSDLIIC